jgi:hypothetical protein
MKIKWKDSKQLKRNHLEINGRLMGWISVEDTGFSVLCMWMREPGDDRVLAGLMYPTQYPEDTIFETFAQARAALLDSARVIYMGGWRNDV